MVWLRCASIQSWGIGFPQIPQPLTTVSDKFGDVCLFLYFGKAASRYDRETRLNGGNCRLSSRSISETQQRQQIQVTRKNRDDKRCNQSADGNCFRESRFPEQEGLLLSGNAGNVIFPNTEKGVIIIPQSATYEIQDKVYAVKVVDGKAAVTELTVSRYNDGHSYLVKSGLVVGDTIVSEGTSMIQDGQRD